MALQAAGKFRRRGEISGRKIPPDRPRLSSSENPDRKAARP
jgi:hypothetical protein